MANVANDVMFTLLMKCIYFTHAFTDFMKLKVFRLCKISPKQFLNTVFGSGPFLYSLYSL